MSRGKVFLRHPGSSLLRPLGPSTPLVSEPMALDTFFISQNEKLRQRLQKYKEKAQLKLDEKRSKAKSEVEG